MHKKQIEHKIYDILKELGYFNINQELLSTLKLSDLNMDSIDLVEFEVYIEDEFNIKLRRNIIKDLTLNDVIDIIYLKIKKK